MPGERRLLPKIFDATAAALLTSVPVFTAVASTSCDRPPASSSPQDFSATTHTGSSSEENAAGAPQGGAILHPTGKHHGWWSLNPIKEAVPWAKRSAKYFADLIEANGGASVFKGHPGLRVTFLTDHASAKWFLSQPESVLDRQDGPYFGSLIINKEYVGEAVPTITANQNESHQAFREHAMGAFRSRIPHAQTAMTHATDTFYENLWENGMGEYNTIYEIFLQPTSNFVHEWIYGLGEDGGVPLPPFKDFLSANPSDVRVCLGLEMDTPVANALFQLAQLVRKPSAEQVASVNSILAAIRSSTVWANFVERLKSSNADPKDLDRMLMCNTNFQSAAAIAKQMKAIIATLTNNPEFLEELRKELDGKDLNFETVKGAENFPLLDSFHWEINRLFPPPPFAVKIAQMDLVVPTSSGKKYQVKKGDALCCELALALMDPSVFGPDARKFNPRRFVESPYLKKKVFAYGYADTDDVDGKQFGCVAHAIGMVDSIVKVFVGRWVQEAEWELTTPAVVNTDELSADVGPWEMAFAKITPRKR